MEMISYTSPRARLRLGRLSRSQILRMFAWCQERWGLPKSFPSGPREWSWEYYQDCEVELDLPSTAAACEFMLASPHE